MFKGRVAIVTGGTRGIGAAISKSLAQARAHVAAGYSKGAEAAEKCAETQRAEGPFGFDASRSRR